MFKCTHGDISCSQYCKDIDNELLILEIKNRPALYNRSVKEYNDQHYKRTMWEEICAKIYHDIWDQMTDTQKEAKGVELVKRWNNLRTCFTRELKIMRDPLQNKRKKYIYFDKLLFLLDEVKPDLITIKEPETIMLSNLLEQEEVIEHNIEKPIEKKTNKKPKNKNRDLEKYVQTSINRLREEIAIKERRENPVESVPKTFDTDADTNFSLSLVPMLKIIPIDKKIDAEIEILNILKKYTSRNTYEYTATKFEREDQSETNDDNISESSYYIDDH